MKASRFNRSAITPLLWKTVALGLAVYLGQRLGLEGVAKDLGPALTMGAIMATEAAKSYIGETGAESFADAFIHHREHDPHVQIRNQDIHEVAGVAIQTLIEVYANEHPEEQAWLEERLTRHFKTRWAAFDPTTTPELDFLQGRFIGELYKTGSAALYNPEQLASTDWQTLLLSVLTGMTEEALEAEGSGSVERIAGLVTFVEANYAPAFTYLLRSNPKAGYGVLLFLQSELLKQTGEIHESVKALANPQPALQRYEADILEKDTTNSAYLYRRRVGVVRGREATYHTLAQFLHDKPGGFQWARLTGLAGSGKSRVALEVAVAAYKENWNAGFLDTPALERLLSPEWQPLVATLVVVDYAPAYRVTVGKELVTMGKLAESLRRRFEKSPVPVRLLALDRSREEKFWEPFYDGIDDHERLKSPEFQFGNNETTLNLLPPAYGERLAILHGELERLHTLEPSMLVPEEVALRATLAYLEERLKEEARPLFLLFAARAIAEGLDEDDWSAEVLVKNVLDIELKHWNEWAAANPALDHKHVNLFFLATLLGGMSPEAQRKLSDAAQAFLPSRRDREALIQLCGFSGGYRSDTGIVPPMLPDLLGELFVLKRLSTSLQLASERGMEEWEYQKAMTTLLAAAWEQSATDVAAFVQRTLQDYLLRADDSLKPALQTLYQRPEGDVAGFFWAALVVGKRLPELSLNNAEEASRLVEQADDIYTLRILSPEARKTLVLQIREVAQRSPDDIEIQRSLASGLNNASAAPDAEFEDRKALVLQIREVAQKFPDDIEIQQSLTKGFYNATVRNPSFEDRKALVLQIREIAQRFPDDIEIQRHIASGLNNASAAPDAGFEDRKALVLQIREIAQKFPDDIEIQRQIASGLYNATVGNPSFEDSKALILQIREIAQKFPDDIEIQRQIASGLYNATVGNPSFEDSKALILQIREIAQRFPDDIGIQRHIAKGLCNATVRNPSFEARKALVLQIREVAQRFPEDSPILNQLFRGWTSTSLGASSEEEWRPCADELVALAQQLSQRPDAVEEWGQFVQLVIANTGEHATGQMFSQWLQPQ